MAAISLSRAMSTWPGSTICTTLLGSRTILLLASSRHSPAAFITCETLGEAGKNLVVEKSTPLGFVHAEAAADIAAEHQLGDLGRPLTTQAIHQLRVGAGAKRKNESQRRNRAPWSPPPQAGEGADRACRSRRLHFVEICVTR